jgi:hypothetical protein
MGRKVPHKQKKKISRAQCQERGTQYLGVFCRHGQGDRVRLSLTYLLCGEEAVPQLASYSLTTTLAAVTGFISFLIG